MIGAAVLAAGRSTRFGANKLLQPLNGKPIVRRVVEAVLASRLEPVVVVTGHESERIKSVLATLPVTFADNPDYSTGLSSSLKRAVKALPDTCDGVMVILGDMPFVTQSLIDRLADCFAPGAGRGICVPVYRGQRGHPVVWARRFFPEILALEGDVGAKALMAQHQECVYELAVEDDGIHIDIDTKDDLTRHE